jgi:hypothetical protein
LAARAGGDERKVRTVADGAGGQTASREAKDQILDSLVATDRWGTLLHDIVDMGTMAISGQGFATRSRGWYTLEFYHTPSRRILVIFPNGSRLKYDALKTVLIASGNYDFNQNGRGLEVIFKPEL